MSSDRAILSIDLEWFTHTPAYRSAEGSTNKQAIGRDGIVSILKMLQKQNASATFFVVSEIGEEDPELLREIAAAGHEIASHTESHQLLTTLNETDRQRELEKSREHLQQVVGKPVTGFRAPAFKLPARHFNELDRAGYEYDSSVAPCRRIPGWYGGEYSIRRPSAATTVDQTAPERMVELPIGVMPGLRLPLTGAWLRFFGSQYTISGMKLLARQGITPVLYVHPWELVDLPAIEGVPRRVYWRTGTPTRGAIKRILAQPFTFVTAHSEVERVTRQ